ncbi:MAG TPA: Gfo/Idh/MocA family oxidoreductase [Sphingomicrobium sp.]|nr:Gfo/Idh/MocA family oxidoreductase [Sphingomicrobium sp.]
MNIPPSRLKAAVIGCGAIAYEHLPFLSQSPLVELVAVCDRSNAAASFAQTRFHAAGSFTDHMAMLADAGPDVVHVLTPPHTHVPIARDCLEAGAHVICEKPMASTADETSSLLDYAAKRARLLVESRNYLFNDQVMEAEKIIESGRLGEVREIDLILSLDFLSGPFGDLNLAGPGVDLPAGAVHDFLPHLAYLFLVFAGHAGEVDDVQGRLANLSDNSRAGFDHLDALIVAGDVRGRIRITSDVGPDSFRVYLRGTEASLETDLFNPFLRFDGPPNVGKRSFIGQMGNGFSLVRAGARNFRNKVTQHGTYHGMPRMLEAIYRSLAGSTEPPFTREQMIDTARLVDRLVALKVAR